MRLLSSTGKKQAAVFGLLALILTMAAGFFYFARQDSFSVFCEKLAKSSLDHNPLKLHYTFADPERMGYGGLSTNLLSFDREAYEKNTAVWQGYQSSLNEYAPDSLSEEEAFTWRILERYFALEEQLSTYLYYENPLSPSDGVHIQLPVLLAEYTFRSREDVENYLLLLSQLPDYFRGLSEYMKLQAENGILQYEGTMETAAQQCESVLNEGQLAAGSHFLQTTFISRLEELSENGEAPERGLTKVTDGEVREWLERNEELLAELALAYQELAQDLRKLPGTEQLAGLSAYPDGKEYYALLLADATGSDRSVGEMKELLYDRLEELYTEYRGLIADGNVISEYDFPVTREADMLEDLYQRMEGDFPTLNPVAQRVTLKAVDAGLEEMMAPAFYLTPPIDQNQEHTIYINRGDGYEGLSLYTTLAHEGFPGHLYQTVYGQNALMDRGAPLIRQLLYFGGYTEGWGLYAEACAYQYAADLMEEEYGEGYGDTVRAAQLNRELQLCLCSILDIFIHYDGATLAQVQKLLESLGFGSGNISGIYDVICNTPTNYPKYFVGYLEILELKELAFESNVTCTDSVFHQWLLSVGPADFTALNTKLSQDF